ncbi:IS110 family transposase [Rhodococcus erythropolis]|uniref:IS110 family transposase n=1 Tax=Rhodococcus erythropolis TaxID=1833 RepID=UPI0002FE4107|nr:IS110 family transposase [Rhodococcus erythropolis]
MDTSYAVFCGIDVGKSEHHAVGLAVDGTRLYDKALPNDEGRLRAVFDRLATHGPLLIVVDQPNTIGALPVTVARSCGHQVAYLPGLSMRRIADLYPGQAKTDARDAFIIADTARTMPHTLRRVDTGDDTLAELDVLIGFDDDLAGEATRISNRIRGLLTGIHPALERVLGPRVTHPAVLEILSRCGGPAGIRAAGKRKLTAIAAKNAPRMGARLVAEIYAALESQTVVVPGSAAAETVLPKLADSLKETLQQRKTIAADVERMLDAHPLSSVLISMPGIGIRTAARILLEVGDGSAFKSAGHLAAYAGIAPVTHRSGTWIRGEHPARSGNRKLKRALFLSAFAALHDPTSRAYYDRKRAEGKKHNAALICLARRRCDVLFAMLKTKTLYQPPTTQAA